MIAQDYRNDNDGDDVDDDDVDNEGTRSGKNVFSHNRGEVGGTEWVNKYFFVLYLSPVL